VDETIKGINVKYPHKGSPVEISGSGTFEGIELFELYSLLRAIYNDRNFAKRRDAETKALRKFKMPDEKSSERLP